MVSEDIYTIVTQIFHGRNYFEVSVSDQCLDCVPPDDVCSHRPAYCYLELTSWERAGDGTRCHSDDIVEFLRKINKSTVPVPHYGFLTASSTLSLQCLIIDVQIFNLG